MTRQSSCGSSAPVFCGQQQQQQRAATAAAERGSDCSTCSGTAVAWAAVVLVAHVQTEAAQRLVQRAQAALS